MSYEKSVSLGLRPHNLAHLSFLSLIHGFVPVAAYSWHLYGGYSGPVISPQPLKPAAQTAQSYALKQTAWARARTIAHTSGRAVCKSWPLHRRLSLVPPPTHADRALGGKQSNEIPRYPIPRSPGYTASMRRDFQRARRNATGGTRAPESAQCGLARSPADATARRGSLYAWLLHARADCCMNECTRATRAKHPRRGFRGNHARVCREEGRCASLIQHSGQRIPFLSFPSGTDGVLSKN